MEPTERWEGLKGRGPNPYFPMFHVSAFYFAGSLKTNFIAYFFLQMRMQRETGRACTVRVKAEEDRDNSCRLLDSHRVCFFRTCN